MPKNLWTREEMLLAFNLYLKLPFGKMHSRNHEIVELARLIGRTANSVAIRLTNFASCDPFHQNRGVKGMDGGRKQCQPIWDEFINNKEDLVFLSENLLAEKQNISLESKYLHLSNEEIKKLGIDKERFVKTRVNQNVFRQMVLSNYENKCAITQISIPELLTASHIIPWSISKVERLNPSNGIALSPLFDKAFDRGLIGITLDYKLIFSSKLKEFEKEEFYINQMKSFEGKEIYKPLTYLPNKEFLQFHLDVIFENP
jgi:putative restriction endonuclease